MIVNKIELVIMNNNNIDSDFLGNYFQILENQLPQDIKDKKNTLNIAIYTRVSTRGQADEGNSLTTQKKMLHNFIINEPQFKEKKQNIIEFIDKGISAKVLKRVALQNMLKAVKNGEVDFILIVKLDRLSRNSNDIYVLNKLFAKYHVNLISLKDNLDNKTATGRFQNTILGSIGQLEREQTSERVKDVLADLVQTQSVGGRTPFGYIYISKTKTEKGFYISYNKKSCQTNNIPGILIKPINEVIYPADYVPHIFSWYDPIVSNFADIARKLTALQIPTPQQIDKAIIEYFRKQETERDLISFLEITNPKEWRNKSVQKIIENPFYIGIKIWNRYDNINKVIRPKHEWIAIRQDYQPLISEQEFFKVFSRIKPRKKRVNN